MKAIAGFVFVVLVVCVGLCSGTAPGFNSIVTQDGLNYANQVGLKLLQQALSTVTIPDVSGDKDTLSYQITGIVLNSLTIGSGSATIDPSVGFVTSLSGITGELTANWHFREDIWPHPSGSGTAQVDVSQTTIYAILKIGESSDGHPTVTAESVSVNIGNLDLHFSGSNLDFILNILKDVFSGLIRNEIETAITNGVTSAINNQLNTELQTLNIDVKIGSTAKFDLSLVSPIVFSSSTSPAFFMLPQHGEFYAQVNPEEAPFTPNPNLPTQPRLPSRMVQLFVDTYVPNTASWVFWKAGKMSTVITPADVPSDSPIQLNTTSWKTLIPALYSKYPDALMQIALAPVESPTVTFNATTGGRTFGEGAAQFFVLQGNKQVPVFTLGINITAVGTAALKGQNITASLNSETTGVWLMASSIGQFSTVALNGLVGYLTQALIVPYFNSYLGVGIPIPALDGFTVEDATLVFQDGYLFLEGDIQYNPPQ